VLGVKGVCRMNRILILLFSLIFQTSVLAAEKVSYFTDSIFQKDGEYIKLLGGSSWSLGSTTFALVTDDVIIVFRNIVGKDKKYNDVPIFYHDGEEIVAIHIKGEFSKEPGLLATVVQQYGEGAKLKLDNGSVLSIPEYDRYDTGWWLPPYPALITSNNMYMWNLKKGKRVWVNGVQ
jgi:hypothetical protein